MGLKHALWMSSTCNKIECYNLMKRDRRSGTSPGNAKPSKMEVGYLVFIIASVIAWGSTKDQLNDNGQCPHGVPNTAGGYVSKLLSIV